jgi:hypothetical protein
MRNACRIAPPALLILMIVGCDSVPGEASSAAPATRETERSADPASSDTNSAAPVLRDSDVQVPSPSEQLLLALRQLVGGTEGESARQTWFSDATAASVRTVNVDSTGHAVVDFHDLRRLIPNASSSAGSAMLLHELDSTVFTVPQIHSVEYRIDGSCARFWEWLQYSCHIVQREDSR